MPPSQAMTQRARTRSRLAAADVELDVVAVVGQARDRAVETDLDAGARGARRSSASSSSGWYIMYHSAQPLRPVAAKSCSMSSSPAALRHS